jgi:hypothetical protein
MNRISHTALAQTVATVRAMDMKQKEHLADELFRAQPNLFGSFLVQKQLGVSVEKMDFPRPPVHVLPGDEGIRPRLAPHYGR